MHHYRKRYWNNPMRSAKPLISSARCGARTRSGNACRSPAMANGRCRMHGGPSTGAPKRNINAYKHGRYTYVYHAFRKMAAELAECAENPALRRPDVVAPLSRCLAAALDVARSAQDGWTLLKINRARARLHGIF